MPYLLVLLCVNFHNCLTYLDHIKQVTIMCYQDLHNVSPPIIYLMCIYILIYHTLIHPYLYCLFHMEK